MRLIVIIRPQKDARGVKWLIIALKNARCQLGGPTKIPARSTLNRAKILVHVKNHVRATPLKVKLKFFFTTTLTNTHTQCMTIWTKLKKNIVSKNFKYIPINY